jgi:hypothetical protein
LQRYELFSKSKATLLKLDASIRLASNTSAALMRHCKFSFKVPALFFRWALVACQRRVPDAVFNCVPASLGEIHQRRWRAPDVNTVAVPAAFAAKTFRRYLPWDRTFHR